MQEETPEWVDYDAARAGGSATADFKSYWREQLTKHFGYVDQGQWSVKNLSQIKNFMKEFGDKDWKQMVYHWIYDNRLNLSRARNIGAFYTERYKIWQAIHPQEKKWTWD